ncbi:MAG: helix-turn-helix domain-containing protein [Pseudomonadota bacterium]
MSERILLNEIEAASRIGRSPATLRSWRCRGRGPIYIKDGGSVMYLLSDLDAYLDGLRRDPRTRKHPDQLE